MGFLEDRDTISVPTIPEYYKGKTILITGGSGFMGQALVEKLLYSCPELDRIYLLMRQKKGVPPEERREKLYSSHCFERLRKEKPTIFLEKVHIIAGDVTELGLGISDDDKALLINRVNIIFHAAASVRFDDPLLYAAKLNIRGTREIINLAKETGNLSAFIHVSTSYSNAKYSVVDEKLYPPLADWRELIEICENLDEETIKILTPKYLNGMPNTYVFTKQLAEHLVCEERGQLPVVLIRPSIVVGSVAEPSPGWINNFNGPGALFIACGIGIKQCVYVDPDTTCDYVPLDACIRNFIVAAWARGTAELKPTDDVPIYNCASNSGMSLRELSGSYHELVPHYPPESAIWAVKRPIMTSWFPYYYVCAWLFHLIPAVLIDFAMRLSGRKPMLLKLQRKIYVAELALYFFATRNWSFINTKFLKLRDTIKFEDRHDFDYNIEGFLNYEYFKLTILGAKMYLLNEKVENLEKARNNQWRLRILDGVVQVIFYGCLLWWFMSTKYGQHVYRLIVN